MNVRSWDFITFPIRAQLLTWIWAIRHVSTSFELLIAKATDHVVDTGDPLESHRLLYTK
jgi:hypothetical protein